MATELTAPELKKGLNASIHDGILSQMMVTLTSGVFLVSLALELGASNVVIGLLAAIPALMQLVQIPAVLLVEKYQKRKRISLLTSIISRSFLFFIVLLPFLFEPQTGIVVLLIVLFIHTGFGAISGCSWNSWMSDLIPKKQLGSFFSKRMAWSLGLSIPLSLSAALFLDNWDSFFSFSIIYAYAILFFLGLIFGLIGLVYLSRVPEPAMVVQKRVSLFSRLSEPFKDQNFKRLMVFTGSWSFAVSLAAPFFTVYMIKRLGYDISVIILLVVLSQIVHVWFLRIWGKFSDYKSNKAVLSISGPLFIFSLFLWTFTTLPETHYFTFSLVVFLHILMGIAMAGVTLAMGTIGLKLAPEGKSTSFLAANSLIVAITSAVGPLLGGLLADFFLDKELGLLLTWRTMGGQIAVQTLNFQQWDFFFFSAFLVGIYALHRLAMVTEKGEVEEPLTLHEVLSEARVSVHNISPMGLVVGIVQFPISFLKSGLTYITRKKP